jgi:hypothetical protein
VLAHLVFTSESREQKISTGNYITLLSKRGLTLKSLLWDVSPSEISAGALRGNLTTETGTRQSSFFRAKACASGLLWRENAAPGFARFTPAKPAEYGLP